MPNYVVTNDEIENAEKDIFEHGEHFNAEQIIFLKKLDSCCVQAYAGTGKTSAIVGKLHILAQKNVWKNGRGICVISHTNVAVDEIKNRVAKRYPSIMEYPNFIGTIQEFVNKFLFIPYLSSQCLRMKFQDEKRFIDPSLDSSGLIITRINNRITQLNHSIDPKTAIKTFYDRLKTIYVNKDKIYASSKDNGFSEYTDLAIKAVPQTTIFPAIKSLIDNKHQNGFFTFVESFVSGLEYLNKNKYLKSIISQRFQFAFLDEAQDCSKDQMEVLNTLFGANLKTIFQQIGDVNQDISGEDAWRPVEPLHLITTERFSQNLADFINKFRIDGGLDGLSGRTQNSPEGNIKLLLIKYDKGKEKEVLKIFAEKLKSKNVPKDKDFYAIAHRHDDLLKNFPVYNKKLATNQNKKDSIHFDDDNDYINLLTQESVQKKGSNFVYRVIFSLLYKHFRVSGGLRTELKDFLETSGKSDELKKIIYNTSVEILTLGKPVNLNILKNSLNIILGSISINFSTSQNTTTPTAASDISQDNIFLLDGIKINVGTIHSVKGQTHNATLFFSNKEESNEDINHALGTTPKRTPKFKKYLYVAASRPKYLFAFAIENNAFNTLTNKNIFQNFEEIVM